MPMTILLTFLVGAAAGALTVLFWAALVVAGRDDDRVPERDEGYPRD